MGIQVKVIRGDGDKEAPSEGKDIWMIQIRELIIQL